jgi:hypothetical protein
MRSDVGVDHGLDHPEYPTARRRGEGSWQAAKTAAITEVIFGDLRS